MCNTSHALLVSVIAVQGVSQTLPPRLVGTPPPSSPAPAGDYAAALESSTAALLAQPKFVKALYRRAQARGNQRLISVPSQPTVRSA